MRVKSEEKRQEILDIAKRSFTQQGFEQTSMSYIAKELGGSKATLYNYFSSKEEIFSAVMESSATEQIANAFLSLDHHDDLVAALPEFGFNFLQSVLKPDIMAIYRMAMNEAERSSIGRHFYENGPKKGWLHLSGYLQHQMEKGHLRAADPWLAAMQLKGLLSAEFFEPYALRAIDIPDDNQIKLAVERAIGAFMALYKL
ncbi:TetR/AcrR family transcriptional regulator [Vibrio nitrifigilis]|uniref:TetR/AcrR family transcriptional regulator n=1 Tax=Vibrio nitrifigilis TaxID=2789781 RepID=A0ABS0GEN5_9VIBR|nr:TetR/AcrR family transcriptional regulator [Vibrio nitrifigilis]MBF9000870.1 TetR/AcrR family transcriptional regulator [Vibrio nitrifigilis]